MGKDTTDIYTKFMDNIKPAIDNLLNENKKDNKEIDGMSQEDKEIKELANSLIEKIDAKYTNKDDN